MSGTVNIVDTSALATVAAQTDGSQKAQVHGPAKGSTVAADATVRTVDADHNALDVSVNGTVALAAGSAVIGHVITDTGSTTAVSSLPAIPTGSNTIGAVTAPGAAALALDATLTGGTTKAIARGGAKGSTVAADVTSTSIDADHTALDVSVKGAVTISGAVTVTSGAMTETNSGTIATNTGTAATNTSTIAGAVNSGAMVVKGGGAAGTAASAVVTVQGIAAMTPVQIGDNSGSLTVDAPVATPVFVRLSDGAAAVAPVTTAQIPASLGSLVSASALCVVRSVPSIDKQTTLATAGKLIKSGPGICYGLTSYFNNTGGAIFFQVFNSTTLPSAGDRPDYFSASIASGAKNSLGFGITALGIACPTGIVFVASSTQDTFTAIASTAVIYALQYD